MTQKSEYDLEFFKENGFVKKRCPKCERHFWTQSDKEICGEPPCDEYTFIGRSLMNKKLNLHEMREAYLSFFEKRGHARIARYPITARWRDDVFFTQASIYDFQPWVINRTVEPPANPLTISQTCVRFNDIDNVGKTGRHFTMFEMMAHHAFNTMDNKIYFKERTLELCNDLLTKELGINEEEISYIEADWAGGGNSGPCFETMVGGVELATLVFMMYEDTPAGKKPMEMQVVDTGYGLERFAWISQGTSSAYEAVFGSVLEKLKNESGVHTASDDRILGEYSKVAGFLNVETEGDLRELKKQVADRLNIAVSELDKHTFPMENLYAICDHTRALMFMLNDGVVPSNVKQGYFARLLVRRTMRALKSLNLNIPISEIVNSQINYFKNDFPDVAENKDEILNLVDIEGEKYKSTVKRGRVVVRRVEDEIKKKGGDKIETDDLIDLYDSHGLIPLVVKDFASLDVEIPDDFYIRVAAKHEKAEVETAEKIEVPGDIEDTELNYYKIVDKFNAKIQNIDRKNNFIILDRTYFYPEGGGQEADTGKMENLDVVDVQKINSVVIHKIKGKIDLNEGDTVECKINFNRRKQLTQNHTATHIINGASRKVLGNHIWQSGAHKSEDIARLDVTHYASLTDSEMEEIERAANKIIAENRKIEIFTLPRNEAEQKYGFRLYQGGAVPGRDIRIVDIKDWDTEACGGTHCEEGGGFTGRTGDVEIIKLIRSKRIQDGVIRLEFVAGDAAKRNIRKQRELFENSLKPLVKFIKTQIATPSDSYLVTRGLTGSADALSVPLEQLSKTTERFVNESGKLRAEIEELGGDIPESKLPGAKTLPDACKILFEEWKELNKQVEKLKSSLKNNVSEKLKEEFKTGNLVKYISHGLEVKDAISLAKEFTKPENRVLILINVSGEKTNVVCASSNNKINAGEVARELSKRLGGGGHGNAKLGMGGGKAKNVEKTLEGFEV